jgi:hypothetical protein
LKCASPFSPQAKKFGGAINSAEGFYQSLLAGD